MQAVEEHFRDKGFENMNLTTYSFQAPEFYKKHGYEVVGVLPDIPNGNQKYLFMKALKQ